MEFLKKTMVVLVTIFLMTGSAAFCAENENEEIQTMYQQAMDYYHDGNFAQAVHWFYKAAQRGHADAQYQLGMRLYRGEGIPQNLSQAISWLYKAAEQNQGDAQYMLGSCYYDGEGVERELVLAYQWFYLAAAQGIQGAASERDEVVQRLSMTDLEEGQRLVSEWYKNHPQVGH